MDVYLLRASLSADDASLAPAQRHLTLEGRRLVRALGERLRSTDVPSVDRCVTSPSPASVQTAELFADRVDFLGAVEVLPALAGGTPPSVYAPALVGAGRSLVVVGDEPWLSMLGAFLVGRPTFPPLVPAQISLVRDRRPEWRLRPDDMAPQVLLVD